MSELLAPKQIAGIWQCLSEDFESVNPLNICIKCQTKPIRFDGIVHRWDNTIILELEHKKKSYNKDYFYFYRGVRGTINKIQKAPSLLEMCGIVVKEVRKITEFDRVTIYKIDTEGAGTIIAEDKSDWGHTYLNLRYPSTDIPQQARNLYTLNWLRLIPDVNYQPTGLTPVNNPTTDRPLDLSHSVLRSVSPIHLEYLQNMGVTASMSISLIKDRQLWGLITCHHSSPKYISYEVRVACEFLGQVMSLELATKEANEDWDYKLRLKSLQTKFIESLSQSEYFLDGIVKLQSNLLELVGASGAVVCSGDRCIHVGQTPPEAGVPALLSWLKHQIDQNNLFYFTLPQEVNP